MIGFAIFYFGGLIPTLIGFQSVISLLSSKRVFEPWVHSRWLIVAGSWSIGMGFFWLMDTINSNDLAPLIVVFFTVVIGFSSIGLGVVDLIAEKLKD